MIRPVWRGSASAGAGGFPCPLRVRTRSSYVAYRSSRPAQSGALSGDETWLVRGQDFDSSSHSIPLCVAPLESGLYPAGDADSKNVIASVKRGSSIARCAADHGRLEPNLHSGGGTSEIPQKRGPPTKLLTKACNFETNNVILYGVRSLRDHC